MPRPGLRSKTQKRKEVKTPGKKNNTHYWRKKPSKAHCLMCKEPLKSVPRKRPSEMKKTNKSSRRASRYLSGRYCHNCLQKLIREAVRKEALQEQ
ncbi:MAG: 50S ribosomal protein L34e [Promethearchaeia archaeon]